MMIDMQEAIDRVLSSTSTIDSTRVPLMDALGYTLSKDITSDINMPPFEKATMDGYAVVGTDVAGASAKTPVTLDVIEEVQAGVLPQKTVSSGKATQIMTGAPVPAGADTVVMVEETERVDGVVRILAPVDPGTNRVPLGEDVREGQVVLKAGAVLRPPEIGILGAVGVDSVPVYRRPVVGVVATGDEIVEPRVKPEPGQIRNSNGYSMATQVMRAGGTARYLGIAADDVENLRRVMTEGIETCDVLLLSGGVSAGVYDLVQGVMKELGVEVRFDRIRMKPGKPLTFGVRGEKLVFGLPGNPVSSVVGLELLVRPALKKMQAVADVHRPRVRARIDAAFRQSPGREQYVPAASRFEDGVWRTRWVGHHGSADLFSMWEANSLFVVDAEATGVEAGDEVEVVILTEW